ncbi:MAG: hypothetical protein WCD18_09100 [Thermosynechococcaceae cyanobacterium]
MKCYQAVSLLISVGSMVGALHALTNPNWAIALPERPVQSVTVQSMSQQAPTLTEAAPACDCNASESALSPEMAQFIVETSDRADSLVRQHQLEAAAKIYAETVILSQPNQPMTSEQLSATVYQRMGDALVASYGQQPDPHFLDEAIISYRYSLQLDPSDGDLTYKLEGVSAKRRQVVQTTETALQPSPKAGRSAV